MTTVGEGMIVSMDYTLRLEGDEIVDSSEGQEPLTFVYGQGAIIPGLEKALEGMALGDAKQVEVGPKDGYGEMDADLVESLPRSVFPEDVEVGMGFRMRTEGGRVVTVYVETVTEEVVTVNLNHPLAGKTLYFDIKIADLREATPEELAGGCSAGCAGCGSGGCGEHDHDCDSEGCEGGCCH